jgi:Ca-activated chloride channel homolog
MNFAHPKMLWLLLVSVLLLSLFFWWSWRRRQFLISQFVKSRLLAHLTVGLSRTVQKTRMALLVAATGCLLLALAQPQWGFAWEEVTQRGLDIVVAVDTSRSMLAEDIAPNRLERAKLAALDLMRLAKRDRLGLVAFAGAAFLQCPLTVDDEAFRQSVNELDVGIIPQGGTALAEAIQTALSTFKNETDNHRVLVLFTDGEDHDTGAVAAAEKAVDTGMRIFTVGVGTANGELLRQRDKQGNLEYVKDADGNVVKSRLNESLLTQIATAGNGFYLPLRGAKTMDVLYQRGLAPLPKAETNSRFVKQFHERYQWPLGLAILLLLGEMFVPDRRRVRRTEAMVTATNPELRKIVAALALALTLVPASASPSAALRKYEAGQFRDAYRDYSQLLERHPDDVRLQYNTGAAAYQAKKFEDAAKHFSVAATAPDLQLQEHAYYNLGNSLYRMGEGEPAPDKKMGSWEQSVREFEAALKLDPKDADAQYNLEFVKKKLEELKKQRQQSKQQKDQQNQKQNKDDQDKSKQQKDKSQDKSKREQNNSEKNSQKPNQPDKNQQRQNQQRANNQQKNDKQDQASSQPKDNKREANTETNTTAEAAVPAGQMTPEQAKQLLESQKNNEKMMIFIPEEKLRSQKRVFKDW